MIITRGFFSDIITRGYGPTLIPVVVPKTSVDPKFWASHRRMRNVKVALGKLKVW